MATDLVERFFSSKKRKKLAKKGSAMGDGSFPIENEKDLRNAERLRGHAKNKAAATAHIRRRAEALGLKTHMDEGINMFSLSFKEAIKNSLLLYETDDSGVDLVGSGKADKPEPDTSLEGQLKTLLGGHPVLHSTGAKQLKAGNASTVTHAGMDMSELSRVEGVRAFIGRIKANVEAKEGPAAASMISFPPEGASIDVHRQHVLNLILSPKTRGLIGKHTTPPPSSQEKRAAEVVAPALKKYSGEGEDDKVVWKNGRVWKKATVAEMPKGGGGALSADALVRMGAVSSYSSKEPAPTPQAAPAPKVSTPSPTQGPSPVRPGTPRKPVTFSPADIQAAFDAQAEKEVLPNDGKNVVAHGPSSLGSLAPTPELPFHPLLMSRPDDAKSSARHADRLAAADDVQTRTAQASRASFSTGAQRPATLRKGHPSDVEREQLEEEHYRRRSHILRIHNLLPKTTDENEIKRREGILHNALANAVSEHIHKLYPHPDDVKHRDKLFIAAGLPTDIDDHPHPETFEIGHPEKMPKTALTPEETIAARARAIPTAIPLVVGGSDTKEVPKPPSAGRAIPPMGSAISKLQQWETAQKASKKP